MSPQTVAKLYNEFDEIVAIKEATGSLDIASEIGSLCDITILSGDDSLTLPLMSVGGKGVISVLSNISPKMVKAITANCLEGNYEEARKAHLKTFKLFKNLFIEPNPQPVKAAMKMLGMCHDTVRLPLVSASAETRVILRELLVEAGLPIVEGQ